MSQTSSADMILSRNSDADEAPVARRKPHISKNAYRLNAKSKDQWTVPDDHPMAALIKEYERWRAARLAADPYLEPEVWRRAHRRETAARLMLGAALLEWCKAARPFADRDGMRYAPVGGSDDLRREPVKREPGPAGAHAEYRERSEDRTIAIRKYPTFGRGRGR